MVLGDEHLDELTPPGEDALQSDGFLLGDDAGSWFDRPGESGEDEGINLVGLGELANRFDEVSGPARVNDGHGDRAGGEHRGGEVLVSACGLHDGQFDARPFKPHEHLLDALLASILAQDTHIEGPLGNVDAYIDLVGDSSLAFSRLSQLTPNV
jgi:hypothetical protein